MIVNALVYHDWEGLASKAGTLCREINFELRGVFCLYRSGVEARMVRPQTTTIWGAEFIKIEFHGRQKISFPPLDNYYGY